MAWEVLDPSEVWDKEEEGAWINKESREPEQQAVTLRMSQLGIGGEAC